MHQEAAARRIGDRSRVTVYLGKFEQSGRVSCRDVVVDIAPAEHEPRAEAVVDLKNLLTVVEDVLSGLSQLIFDWVLGVGDLRIHICEVSLRGWIETADARNVSVKLALVRRCGCTSTVIRIVCNTETGGKPRIREIEDAFAFIRVRHGDYVVAIRDHPPDLFRVKEKSFCFVLVVMPRDVNRAA